MFNLNKINDKFQALSFYEYSNQNYTRENLLEDKCKTLVKFLRAKNKHNHLLVYKDKTFIVANKEIFIEQLIQILNLYEKIVLYNTFIKDKCHFITTRPKLCNIFKNDIQITQIILLSGFGMHFDTGNWSDYLLDLKNSNWSYDVIHDLAASAEYDQYVYSTCLHRINKSFEDYSHIVNFKYLFDIDNFTKNFWIVYQLLIYHPHKINDNIQRVLTLTENSYISSTPDSVFKYINEYLMELNFKNIPNLFEDSFISFILTHTINGKPIDIHIYDYYFNQFVKYCRKELNK